MKTISTTTARPSATGSFAKVFGWLGAAWQERNTRAALGPLSEREFQDIGWGQADRWSAASTVAETAEERHARRVALRAWSPAQKAA
jgi:uncharacterized protein YjiS (DUF1127 family)